MEGFPRKQRCPRDGPHRRFRRCYRHRSVISSKKIPAHWRGFFYLGSCSAAMKPSGPGAMMSPAYDGIAAELEIGLHAFGPAGIVGARRRCSWLRPLAASRRTEVHAVGVLQLRCRMQVGLLRRLGQQETGASPPAAGSTCQPQGSPGTPRGRRWSRSVLTAKARSRARGHGDARRRASRPAQDGAGGDERPVAAFGLLVSSVRSKSACCIPPASSYSFFRRNYDRIIP